MPSMPSMRLPSPWCPVAPLSATDFARMRQRAIFECFKWDPQVHDGGTLSAAPLVLRQAAWDEVVPLAEALAHELAAAEAELVGRPELHRRLGLPGGVRAALRDAASSGATVGAARLVRFDFHFTEQGWRISEANSDVPGGLNEASGLPALLGPHYPGTAAVGDPVARYVEALIAASGRAPAMSRVIAPTLAPTIAQASTPTIAPTIASTIAPTLAPTIALVHATAYSDDQQMLVCVGQALRAAGATTHLASPAHLRWRDGRAWLVADWWEGPLDAVVRFFPGEWLPGLPRGCGWRGLFAGGLTPVANPATALLTQTKRFPLVWDALRTELPTWRALLPETRDPRDAPWRRDESWVLKPALGRVGDGIGLAGVVPPRELRKIHRAATWHPRDWVAQRRFTSQPLLHDGVPRHPCLGVYTIDGRVVGAYGRIASKPLIDGHAQDAAVLVGTADARPSAGVSRW